MSGALKPLGPSPTHATHYHANGRFRLVVELASHRDDKLRIEHVSLPLLPYFRSFSGTTIYVTMIAWCVELESCRII